jgi:hypothetical protein
MVAQLVEEPLVRDYYDVASSARERQYPVDGLRDQRLGAEDRHQLLRTEFARERPEALARTSGQYDGEQVRVTRQFMLQGSGGRARNCTAAGCDVASLYRNTRGTSTDGARSLTLT